MGPGVEEFMKRLPIVMLNDHVLWSPDVALRQKCRSVNIEDKDELSSAQNLILEMFRTLYDDPSGVALAAPQVGVLLRVVTIDFEDRDTKSRHLFGLINPEISSSSEEMNEDTEICLSVPNYAQKVARSNSITVNAHSQLGKPIEFSADGFFARVIQHELDHLDGILYIDRVQDELIGVPDWPDRRIDPTLRKLKLKS